MPDKSIVPKSNTDQQGLAKVREPSWSTFRRYAEPKNSLQCARRKLQYSKLPIRCQKQTSFQQIAKSPFKLSNTAANTKLLKSDAPKSRFNHLPIFSLPHAFNVSPCRKSLSMVNLSPTKVDQEMNTSRTDSIPIYTPLNEDKEKFVEKCGNGLSIGLKMWMESKENELMIQEKSMSRAAGIVCHTLIIHAWRRRREEIVHMNKTVENLNQQIDHQRIQILVLRRLLNSENVRVSKLTSEVHRLKYNLDEMSLQCDEFKKDKEKFREEAESFKELSEDRLIRENNLRNDLEDARNQLKALDNQMARDREKLLKLREDKKILMEKISTSEAEVTENGKRAKQAELEAEDLQFKLAAQVSVVTAVQEELHRYAEELKITKDERQELKKQLHASTTREKDLTLRVTNLESQLSDRDAALRRIEATYSLQLSELNDLRERFMRQSEENGWSNRVLQIAGSVVRAPRAIFRSLSLLSNSGIILTS